MQWTTATQAATLSDPRFPKISEHSKTVISAYAGDKITLTIAATGENLKFRWIRMNETLCRDSRCTFDTSKWSIGKSEVVMVAFNKLGSRSIRFMVRVLARPATKKPKSIVPDMVPATRDEKLTLDDLYVKSIHGIGYSYHDNKVQVIGHRPRAIEWAEKLKTHVKGIVKFGRRSKEEHFVLPNGVATLVRTDTGQRGILLVKGTIRSRHIERLKPNWSLLVEDWLQIDTDQKGDVIVQRQISKDDEQPDKVTIISLRGYTRIFYHSGGEEEDPEETGDRYILPPGAQVVLTQGQPLPRFTNPDHLLTRQVVKRTSPQYFLTHGKKPAPTRRRGAFLNPDIKTFKGRSYKDALKNARQAFRQQDYFMALEQLLPVYPRNKKRYLFNLIMARSYQELSLYKTANKFFQRAIAAKKTRAEAYYQVGLMYAESKNWRRAIKWLDRAEDLGHKKWQHIHYYRGVAYFNLAEYISARNQFKYSLWQIDDEELKYSAKKFLIAILDERPYGADGAIGFGYDSNVFRLPDDLDDRAEETKPAYGQFYDVMGRLYYTGYSQDDGRLHFSYQIDRRGYINSGLTDVEIVDQIIKGEWGLVLLDPDGPNPFFYITGIAYVGTMFIGEERGADRMGAEVDFGSPFVWSSPRLKYTYAAFNDPLPARDDIIDPYTREVVVASDRSADLNQFDLGMDLYTTNEFNLALEIRYGAFVHDNTLVNGDDFVDIGGKLITDYRFSHHLTTNFEIGYFNRNYEASDDNRKDNNLGVNWGFRYLYTPNFYNDLKLEYTNQTSNRDESKYDRMVSGLYLTLEL